MNKRFSWQQFIPHAIAILGFLLISVLYSSPILSGKRLKMHDIVQAGGGAAEELKKYHEQTGEWAAWTNSMFSGMPSYMITGNYPTSISNKIGGYLYGMLPVPVDIFFVSLISAYLLFFVLSRHYWLSAIGAITFTFASFNLVSLEAGHVSKIMAVAYAPGIIAGVLLAFRRNWLTGAAVTGLFLSLELYANHIQITYYIGLSVAALVILEAWTLFKAGKTKNMLLALSGLALGAALAVSNHTTRLWNAYDYTKETIRGKSELTQPTAKGSAKQSDGLDKDYAYYYGSVGIAETLTLLIPNLYGGASGGTLTDKSALYKTLIGRGVDQANAKSFVEQPLPLYWGDQPLVGGPVYAGAIVFFLFVLSLFLVKGRLKWWALGFTLLYIVWSWGKNFTSVNYFFFDHFPLFNKFRSVSMVLSLAQLLMVLLAVLCVKELSEKTGRFREVQKPFLISLGLTAGICLILGVMPTLFFGFRSAADQGVIQNFTQMTQDQNFANELFRALQSDRQSMLQNDAFRSLFFIVLSAALLWLWLNNKMKPVLIFAGLLLLTIADTFGIGKRYLNNDDFVSKFAIESVRQPSTADAQILADKDLSYRVLDQRGGNFMSSADASYLHKSIGGYHGAKLRRYQELIENQFMNGRPNPDVLNMLNTKYVLTGDQQGNPTVMPNPDAFGNAWFVKGYDLAANADEELKALDSLKMLDKAIIDKKFAPALEGLQIHADSGNTIKLVSYKPDELVYETNAKSEQLAVFSEIYYNVRNEWQVKIDDKEGRLIRANYVLRALRVPAGKHTITFKFDPVSIKTGHAVDLVTSILLVLLMAGAVWSETRKKSIANP